MIPTGVNLIVYMYFCEIAAERAANIAPKRREWRSIGLVPMALSLHTPHIDTTMRITPHFPAQLRTHIDLPASKSLSNRALLLCALSGRNSCTERLSDCDDTRVMRLALDERRPEIDVMAAGTAMRFLTTGFSICEGEEHVLTGTQRMRERPIGVLVDALRELGADIDYVEREGFPPLRIRGKRLRGDCLTLPADVSSQYISALLMVGPMMEKGLTLTLKGEIISRPYIDMTLALMAHFGARAGWRDGQTLYVAPGGYRDGTRYCVESDWSAASYWYEAVALSRDDAACVELAGLRPESLQGDSAVRRLFEPLGVRTEYCAEKGCVVLRKTSVEPLRPGKVWEVNLAAQPDLAQTLVVTCAILRRPFRFTGLQTLRIKETDRMAALTNELEKFGITLCSTGHDTLYIKEYPVDAPAYDGRSIATYHDHRMAMAFAPAALVCEGVTIDDAEVVSKSYPGFWNDVGSL